MPSTRDYLYQEGFERFPALYCNERFPELDDAAQLDCIIELALPWFFNFYVSWYDACAKGQVEALWLAFDEVVADWPGTLRSVLEFYRIEKSDDDIERALERTRSMDRERIRLNKGVRGRGRTALTAAQRDRIRNYARFYPWVDFSRIGIPADPA